MDWWPAGIIRFCVAAYGVGFAVAVVWGWVFPVRACAVETDDEDEALTTDNDLDVRLGRAAFRREAAQAEPGWISPVVAAIAVVCGYAEYFTPVAPTIPYAVLMATLGASTLVRYMRPTSSVRRAAVLEGRSPNAILPGWLIATGFLVPLCALSVLPHNPAMGIAAIISAGTDLFLVVASLMLTRAPAVLTGDDLVVERFIDGRVRRKQALGTLLLAGTSTLFLIFLSGTAGWYFLVFVFAAAWSYAPGWMRLEQRQDERELRRLQEIVER